MIATAPGKLILTGEYAVLDGAPALVIAVDRRVIARQESQSTHRSSPFLLAVARELAQRYGADSPGARAALEIAVDSSAFYDGSQKLGLGSSAAVTVAAAALALAAQHPSSTIDSSSASRGDNYRREILAIALAAHANAQGAKGARGSGADVAAAVYGGTIVFTMHESPTIERRRWPAGVALIPFFTGASADTATLVSRVAAAREASPDAVDAALSAIADASRAACATLAAPADLATTGLVAALELAAVATDRLAAATGADLVPTCVTRARSAMQALGGTAKTTGAGGGDIAIAVIPASADVTFATRLLIEQGCQPLQLTVDDSGVDTRSGAQ